MKTSNRRMEDWRQIDQYICPMFAVFEVPGVFAHRSCDLELDLVFEMLPLLTNKSCSREFNDGQRFRQGEMACCP